jgi:demethylspheroidene O-methyltransferase
MSGWWGRSSDRWLGWRNQLMRSRVFQRRAAAFALTRPITRQRAGAVFDVIAGFVYSQVLLACVQLKVFDRLSQAPATVQQLAQEWGMGVDAAERLVLAAGALKLLQKRSDGRYTLGALGAPLVGNAALVAMIEHHRALYRDLADPVALLRQGQAVATRSTNSISSTNTNTNTNTSTPHTPASLSPTTQPAAPDALASFWPYAGDGSAADLPAERVAAYSALMTASQPLVADDILDAYPITRHHTLLDVGGGEGNFLASAAARAPKLQLMLFDLPAVVNVARERFAERGLLARASCHGGDFFRDALPPGADVISLVRVVHDHDDARVLTLLRAAYQALPPGGTLLLAEQMAGAQGAEAMGDAYFGFYLWAMGRGQPRTAQQLRALLTEAGFVRVQQKPTHLPLQVSLLVAHKAGDSRAKAA